MGSLMTSLGAVVTAPLGWIAELADRPLRLWQRFAGGIHSAQTLAAPKPAPDVYLHAALALGVPPSDCVVIEDSVSGLRAALAAGMRCFGFAATDDGAELAAAGARVFHRMEDLPDLLGIGDGVGIMG